MRVGDKLARHHPDDGMRFAVDDERALDDARVARKPAAPERLAENDRARAADLILLGAQCATDERLGTEDREEPRRHSAGSNPLGC
jgi:hypothetical protein